MTTLFLLAVQWNSSGTGLRVTSVIGALLAFALPAYSIIVTGLLATVPGGQSESLHVALAAGSSLASVVGLVTCIVAITLQVGSPQAGKAGGGPVHAI